MRLSGGNRLEFGTRKSGSANSEIKVIKHLLQCRLDDILGNSEGYFDINGHSFSRSARKIRLVGHVLHAQLATSGGHWCDDQVAVEIVLPPPDCTNCQTISPR